VLHNDRLSVTFGELSCNKSSCPGQPYKQENRTLDIDGQRALLGHRPANQLPRMHYIIIDSEFILKYKCCIQLHSDMYLRPYFLWLISSYILNFHVLIIIAMNQQSCPYCVINQVGILGLELTLQV
jgi:hypothetical protein